MPTEQSPEAVVARLRPHVRAMVWPSFGLIVIVAVTAYFAGSFDSAIVNGLIIAAAVLLSLFVWVVPLLAWLGRNYTITTRRIVLRSGFLVRVRQELMHSRGYDVTVRKGALQSMFGSGDVEINSGLDRPVVLRDVPDADLVQAALHDLMDGSLQAGGRARGDFDDDDDDDTDPDETMMWGRR
jgi:membrane protein YdbS with pleckstrin-like domain